MQCSWVVSQVPLGAGKRAQFNFHSQAGAGSGGLARSPHHRAVHSSALVSELVAVAAWSSWQSLACPQYCMVALSGSQGFGLLFLQSISEPTPRGRCPRVNNLLQRGHVGERQSGMGRRCQAGAGQHTHWDSWNCPLGGLTCGCFFHSSSTDGGHGFLQLGVMHATPGAAGERGEIPLGFQEGRGSHTCLWEGDSAGGCAGSLAARCRIRAHLSIGAKCDVKFHLLRGSCGGRLCCTFF